MGQNFINLSDYDINAYIFDISNKRLNGMLNLRKFTRL